MKGGRAALLVSALLVLAAPVRVSSQQEASGRMPVWLTFGVGPFRDYEPRIFAGHDPNALALTGHISFATRAGVLTGGVTTDLLDLDTNADHAYGVDLLWGWRVTPGGGVYVAASTGVSGFHMQTYDGALGADKNYTVGLPIAAQITATSRNLGFGGQFYTNLNHHRSFYTVTLLAQIGRIWP
jgi:hypothetical protein